MLSAPAFAQQRTLIDQYCVTCHNQRTKTAGLMLDTLDLADVSKNAATWEKVVRKLRGGMMPPPGARRPDQSAIDSFVGSLENSLDEAAARTPNPGKVALHRLNRAEYANAVEDLLGLHIDASALLPKDDEADGFDNIASVLKVSPSFLDQYIAAARIVSGKAVPDASPKPESVTLRPPRGTDQAFRVDGLPPGTRGGFLAEHVFPADGEYKFNISGLAGAFYVRGMEYQHTLQLRIDGVKVFEQKIGGEEDMKAIDQKQAPAVAAINGRFQNILVPVKAGSRKVAVFFVARTYAESDEVMQSFKPAAGEDRIPRISSLEIIGPFNPVGAPSANRSIFVCRPDTSAGEQEELACARKILTSLARHAFRRPVRDKDLTAPLAFYRSGRQQGSFDAGIRNALAVILASPKFLYRTENFPATVATGSIYKVSDLELASRLAFFLTGSVPDNELLSIAEAGRLKDPQVLEQQTRRLLSDPREKTLVTSFAFQWLKLRGLDDVDPDGFQFPNFDSSLREAFRKEIELFVQSIVREDRSVMDLLSANDTFLNERLALHYGISTVRGTEFRRVTLEDPNRRGLLGKGAILMATSYPNRTAPVLRGAWILENILGTPPAPPPPNVEAFQENKPGEKARTVREIMERHRANPSCNGCHGIMDPLGFALENFDGIGGWRVKDRDAGEPIDASGQLVDGTKVSGPQDLHQALLRKPEQFVQTFTEKLLTYAIGRSVEYYDMPAVRKIVRDSAPDGYRFSSIVTGIVQSAPFQMRNAD